jgi:hypothetical protein
MDRYRSSDGPGETAAIKTKLVDDRLTVPLFVTERFTRHIEAACTAMYW